MPVQVSYPGVYVIEQPSGVVSISGVSTSIALFIGMTQRGPLNRPTLVLNNNAFEQAFGADVSQGELPDQVRQFFLNGGTQAYIMRVAQGAQQANVEVDNEFGVPAWRFTARDAGLFGERINFEIDYETSDPENTFNLRVWRLVAGPGGVLQQTELEEHKDLSANPASGRYLASILARDSNLLIAEPIAGIAATAGFSLSGMMGVGAAQPAASADLLARVNAAIAAAILAAGPGTTAGRFDISVDGQPFVTVALPPPIAALADIETRINAALAPVGGSVTVNDFNFPGGPGGQARVLRIISALTAASSAVRIQRASGLDDIAGALQLGVDNGGIEIGGSSAQRPMATGIVAQLGAAPGDVASVGALLRETRANVTGLRITDAAGAIVVAFGLPAGGRLFEHPVSGDRNLREGRNSLDAIVSAINVAAAAPPVRWRAVRSGLRIVLKSQDLAPDTGLGTAIANSGGGAFDWGVEPYLLSPMRVNVRAYRMGAYAPLVFSDGNAAGLNGTSPALNDYTLAYEVVRREVDLFNLMLLPRNTGQTDDQRAAIWGPASVFCRQRRAVLLVDPRADWTNVTQARAGLPALRTGIVKDHSAIYWPRITILDQITGVARFVDPAGSVAGVAARIDVSRGVWKASAGLEASILGVRGVERRMSDDENGVINPEALNAIRVFPTGVVVWGARTMDGFDNSGNTDYRYLPVRRTALMIEESLYRGLQFAVFEPNDEPLWAQIRLAAGAFMNGLFRQGAFQGQKASDAYFVKCDADTTTQTDINLGIVNVLVGFAPLRPAEFIVLIVKQKAGQVQT